MKNYGYIARDTSGEQKEGLVQADSSTALLEQLHSQGFTPISIKEVASTHTKSKKSRRHKRIKSAELASLCWQLTVMLEGGIPVTSAMEIVSQDIENGQLQKVLQQLSEKVKKGQPFSESVAEFPKIFNRLTCAILLAGETSGNLAGAMQKLAMYFENRDKLAKKVKGAMAYPIFVMTFITGIVIFIMAFIVPRFKKIFDQIGGELPAFTRAFMGVYSILAHNIFYIIGGIILLVIALKVLAKTRDGHYFFSKIVLSLPLFGGVFTHAFIVTFCRTAATLLSAGVSVIEVFNILSSMTNNEVIKTAIVRAREYIVGGSNISLSMGTAGFFPNMVVKMIQVGEESGSLPEVLEKSSQHYERKVDATITTMMSLLEPIMIVSVGAVVSVVVIALYLPIFTMSDV
jgi:type IV pilus assembly protein PilC